MLRDDDGRLYDAKAILGKRPASGAVALLDCVVQAAMR